MRLCSASCITDLQEREKEKEAREEEMVSRFGFGGGQACVTFDLLSVFLATASKDEGGRDVQRVGGTGGPGTHPHQQHTH